MADWSGLPSELLGSILGRLTAADYIRFGGVCSSWHSAVGERRHLPAPQVPWVMLPRSSYDDTRSCEFGSLTEKTMRTYTIRDAQEFHWNECIGSSEGWLMVVDESTGELHALNPITKAQIHLPSVFSFPDGNVAKHPVEPIYTCYFRKAVVLSSSPPGVAVLCKDFPELAFARAGDEAWTVVSTPFCDLQDMVIHQGTLYAVGRDNQVLACDLNSPINPVSTTVVIDPAEQRDPRNFGRKKFLAALPGKLLLLVSTGVEDVRSDGTAVPRFEVFKLEMRSGGATSTWVEVKSLGGHAMFLGDLGLKVFSTLELPELRSDCIYFPFLGRGFSIVRNTWELGVFDLRDGSVELHHHLCDYQYGRTPPIWFEPNLL